MKHTNRIPGEFTELFGKTGGAQTNEPEIHFPLPSSGPCGDFADYFGKRRITAQSEVLHEKCTPDFLLKDPPPMIPDADAVERATQIIHQSVNQQRDKPVHMPKAPQAKDVIVPPIAPSQAPTASLPLNQPGAGVSMGTVMLLLFGLFVALHVEAILILLVARH